MQPPVLDLTPKLTGFTVFIYVAAFLYFYEPGQPVDGQSGSIIPILSSEEGYD